MKWDIKSIERAKELRKEGWTYKRLGLFFHVSGGRVQQVLTGKHNRQSPRPDDKRSAMGRTNFTL